MALIFALYMYIYRIYSRKFLPDKHFAIPSYPCITEIFAGITFRQCGKGPHIFCVIISTGQKIRWIKISPMHAGGEIGENFLLAKIFSYRVCRRNLPVSPIN